MTLQTKTLSLCMIVRDEAKTLPRCLESLQGLYDELCIVDTGSQDETVEIAQAFGAKTLSFTECNGLDGQIEDFAKARNASLALATSTWVLQVDADEVLESGRDLVHASLAAETACVGVTIISGEASWVSGRLFRLTPSLRYTSRIHEYAAYNGRFDAQPKIQIHNLPNKDGKESSRERNIRLCKLTLQEDPADARTCYFLAAELHKTRSFQEAITWYEKAWNLGTFPLSRYHNLYYLAVCYLLTGTEHAALETAHKAFVCDPRRAEAQCLLADIHYRRGDLQTAERWYQGALSCGKPPIDSCFAAVHWAYKERPLARLKEIRGLSK